MFSALYFQDDWQLKFLLVLKKNKGHPILPWNHTILPCSYLILFSKIKQRLAFLPHRKLYFPASFATNKQFEMSSYIVPPKDWSFSYNRILGLVSIIFVRYLFTSSPAGKGNQCWQAFLKLTIWRSYFYLWQRKYNLFVLNGIFHFFSNFIRHGILSMTN